MADHPAGYLLDELAAGGGDDETARHLEDCPVCRQYVDRLTAASQRFAAEHDAGAFADEILARQDRTNGTRWGISMAIAVPVVAAIAAGVFFWIHPASGPNVPAPSAVALAPTEPTGVRFKGAPQLAVIREREGQQLRMSVDAGIRAQDRLRVEISLDAPTLIEIGVLSTDGSWATLQPAQMLTAGTHYSSQAVKFDDAPSDGWVIAGSPDAVQRARDTHEFRDVAVVPLRVERTP